MAELPPIEDGFWVSRRENTDVVAITARAVASETDETKATFIASTGAEDRMGDFVEQNWRLKNYRRNPVVLLEHRTTAVIGSGKVKATTDDELGRHLVATATWDVGEHNPQGTLAAAQHARGFRNAVSVGFTPRTAVSRKELPDDDERKVAGDIPWWAAGFVFQSPELIEFSSVAIPANVDAVQLRTWYEERAGGELTEHDEQLEAYLREFMTREATGWVLTALRSDPSVRAAIRAALAEDPTVLPLTTSTQPPGSVDALLADMGI